jgi:flagellar biosynthetic protein FlhB
MSGDDKTEAPTPKKKRENRKEGRVAKSQELVTWGAVLLGSFVLPMSMGASGRAVREVLVQTGEAMAEPQVGTAVGLLGVGLRAVLSGVLPLAIAMAAFSTLANVGQTGLVFATKRLKPSAKHLNPLQGFKRLFSIQSGWNTAKVTARTAVLVGAAWFPMRSAVERLSSADRPPLTALIASVGSDALSMVRMVAIAGLALGLVDYVVVRKRTMKQVKMTKQEVKDEHKQSEGDPHVKGAIRSRQREMSRNRMIAAVGDASVVIVNPIHVAVALQYEQGGGAPRVVAKGKGEVATRIRAKAEEHRVPMVRDIPLAWALHDTCKLDQPVPAELYAAVAKVLAFVLTVGKRAAAMGGIVSLPAGR